MTGGVESMKGKVLSNEGQYFIQYENQIQEIDPRLVGGVEVLKQLEGQEVELVTQVSPWIVGVISDKVRIVCYLPAPDVWGAVRGGIGAISSAHLHLEQDIAQVKIPRVICYVPADWVIRGVEDVVRRNLLKQFVEDKIIGAEVYDRLAG